MMKVVDVQKSFFLKGWRIIGIAPFDLQFQDIHVSIIELSTIPESMEIENQNL